MTGKSDKQGRHDSDDRRQAYHIDHADVVAPGASTVVNRHTVIIRFTFTIRIDGDFLERLFRLLSERFGTAWRKERKSDFDGESSYEALVYELEGAPSAMVPALRHLREELGDDATTAVCYISRQCHFQRGGLTLSRAIQIATCESDL